MFQLKEYQQRALDALRGYLVDVARTGDADLSFYQNTRQTWGKGIPYRPVREVPGIPYVCLRLPTGGGKTVVACHAVRIAARDLLHTEQPVVLWLVPSNAIRDQTLRALRDRQHPYRQALEAGGAAVAVLDVAEALAVSRPTLDGNITVVVATLQAFRRDETEGLKVYQGSGALMDHFAGLPAGALDTLEQREDGSVAYSLANVLRLRRPIVIVDEAHNARTPLSFETLARFNPACILEFTATPDTQTTPSNVLYSVSAAELKAEAMVKLPILLETRPDWRELLADAIGQRSRLEEAARRERQETGEYLRPILLLQAQARSQRRATLTVETLEQTLRDDFHIPADQIARATSEDNQLYGVNLLDPTCPIRFVLTVQALREGWDCPFAYVLCSVAELRASTAVEQLLGRVLRLPQARWKAHPQLNQAYAFVASPRFAEAAAALTDALVQNGFERQEADGLINRAAPRQEPFDGPLFQQTYTVAAPVTLHIHEAPQGWDALPAGIAAKVGWDAANSTLSVHAALSEAERDALAACFATPAGRAVAEQAFQQARRLSATPASPAERGEPFSVPLLAFQQGSLLEPFEATHFLDHTWHLTDCDAALSEAEFAATRPVGQQAMLDITDKGQLETRFVGDLHQQMTLLASDQGWTVAKLVLWLDRAIPHPDIPATESGVFLTRLVRTLIDARGFTLDQLVHDKYRLRHAAEAKIAACRTQANGAAFQALLALDAETRLVVTPDLVFNYPPDYPYNRRYAGRYHFTKHYYLQVGDLEAEGEEWACAQFLDTLPAVRFWVRNLERRLSHSFWLQTATDKFYPDFVCLLHDGRVLVVEYKGDHLWTSADAIEKRNLGELWEARSEGRGLFIMPRGRDFEAIRRRVATG